MAKSFLKEKFTPRTEKLTLPAIEEWFGESWEVRGLTASELSLANDAAVNNSNLSAIVSALDAVTDGEKVEELRASIGLTDNVPGETAKRLRHLVHGSVEPKIKLNVAVKLAENFPIEFIQLTNKIVELTGRGSVVAKKSKSSGKTEG